MSKITREQFGAINNSILKRDFKERGKIIQKLEKENQQLKEQLRVRGERMEELYRALSDDNYPAAHFKDWFTDEGKCKD